VTGEMITGMKEGSIIVDLAAESGGNVEGTIPGEEAVVEGVKIIGLKNGANHVAEHASQMYSSNILSFITEFWDEEQKGSSCVWMTKLLRGVWLLTKMRSLVRP